jgi:tetratricopeptide (TPR) repeat protein
MSIHDTLVSFGFARADGGRARPKARRAISRHAAPHKTEEQYKARVFISYSRKDMAFADRLDVALEQRGFEPLIDRTDIYVFEDWWQRIQSLIVQADTVVFVLSPDSVSSPVCKREVEFATSRNKRLAPIEICPVDTAIIPAALERCNFELFDNSEMFEQNVDRLAEALQLDIGWIRKHTEFGDQAHNWTAAGRPGGLLLRSPTLEEAEHWIASRPRNAPAPTPQTQAFIAESRRAASRQRDVLIGSLTAGLIAAIGLAGSALWQRWIAEGERVIAEEAKLTAQSESDRAKKTLEAAELLANALVVDFGQDPQVRSSPDLQRKIFDRAIEGYNQMLVTNRSDPVIYKDRGNAYLEKRNFDDAIADYDRAIKLDPSFGVAYSNRCWARVLANKEMQEALSDCSKALALFIAPDNVRAIDNLGYVYLRLDRYDDAIASFNAAIEMDPAFAYSLYGRGLAKLKKNDQEGAQADMAAAAAIRPTIAEELGSYGIE